MPDSSTRGPVAWHPDGASLLAAAGVDNDIVLYERLSWSTAYSLTDGHTAAVTVIAFSPNGKQGVACRCDCWCFTAMSLV